MHACVRRWFDTRNVTDHMRAHVRALVLGLMREALEASLAERRLKEGAAPAEAEGALLPNLIQLIWDHDARPNA
jgi:hypothetical protein